MSLAKVGAYAFYNHPKLEKATISAAMIEANAFQSATNLNVVDLKSDSANSIAANAFNGCSGLKHLLVRSSAVSSLAATSALGSTPIALGDGGIYVPANLLASYKAATNWVTYKDNIFPIGDYPKSVFDSIDDSWATILSNASYSIDYAVKGTKTLELSDGTLIKMDIAAFDTDDKSDDSGKAKITWICHGIPFTHRMNATSTTSGGWAESEMRSWLISEILAKIPNEIRSHIVSVKKTYRSKSPNDETLTSNDEIWIPSYKEVGFTDSSYIESDGVTYPTLFPSGTGTTAKNARKKYNTSGSAYNWWLRSAYSTTYFSCVSYSGGSNSSSANLAFGVVFGFCTD